MNKKGAEWPSFLISSIFSMLLFIIGIFIVLDVAKSTETTFKTDIAQLNFDSSAARVLNSADCLAWEEQTPAGYLVHAGIIDTSKMQSNRLSGCLSGAKYYVEAKYNSVQLSAKNGGMIVSNDVIYVGTTRVSPDQDDWFAVKVYDNGNLYDGVAVVAVQ